MSKQISVVQDTHTAVTRAEARFAQLARRTAFDLNLLRDAALAANIPLSQLANIQRARREMNELVTGLKAKDEG
jgi:hypothetical protein